MVESKLCIVCHLRMGIYFDNRACEKCSTRTAVEGTREKHGLPKPRNTAKRRAAFIATYNRMRAQGATLKDIAKQMRYPVQSVKNMAGGLRAQGFKLEESRAVDLRRPQPQPPVDRSTLSRKANEHGAGKTGISKCKCELCLQRRRAYQQEWAAANPEKVKTYRRDYSKK